MLYIIIILFKVNHLSGTFASLDLFMRRKAGSRICQRTNDLTNMENVSAKSKPNGDGMRKLIPSAMLLETSSNHNCSSAKCHRNGCGRNALMGRIECAFLMNANETSCK